MSDYSKVVDELVNGVTKEFSRAQSALEAEISKIQKEIDRLRDLRECLGGKLTPAQDAEAKSAADEAQAKLDEARAVDDHKAKSAKLDEAKAVTADCCEKLEQKLKALEDNVREWGFGTDREDGRTVPIKGSWADWATETVVQHQQTLHGADGESGLVKRVDQIEKRLNAQGDETLVTRREIRERSESTSGPKWSTVALYTLVGAVTGLVIGLISLFFGAALFGPVFGTILGALIGFVAGVLVSAMRSETKTESETKTTSKE